MEAGVVLCFGSEPIHQKMQCIFAATFNGHGLCRV